MFARLTVVTLVVIAMLLAKHPPEMRSAAVQHEDGGEWLSWDEAQRNNYIYGFISGYAKGSLDACNSADELFEVGRRHQLGDQQHPSEMPSARCLARRATFSKCTVRSKAQDCGAYSRTITAFYKAHPEYVDIPFPWLLGALKDGAYSTVEQLYVAAERGELRKL